MAERRFRHSSVQELRERTLAGEIEVDCAYIAGYVKPANDKESRFDRRKVEHPER